MSPRCNRQNLSEEFKPCHSDIVDSANKTDIKVTAVGKLGNVWFQIELPTETVTALVTVLVALDELTQLRIEVTR